MSISTNTLAIVTLMLGLIGLMAPPFALIAVPFGHISLKQIRRTGERGRGMAKAGLIIGYFYVAVVVIAVLIVVPSVLLRN
ncbi:hypothetical protein MycrhDRAFT_5567 [Mycolicibacterium rhodesiae JS60]|nr:hypothetical protein MycrhDRAFT_5567 [Mycolicibacterium rhodesiae JS60]